MQSKRGKALSVVTAATLAASLGVPVVASQKRSIRLLPLGKPPVSAET